MEKIKIDWLQKDSNEQRIQQIYSQGLEYALSAGHKQCCDFVYCKDFLQDVIWANVNKSPVEIYNFKYDPGLIPINLEDQMYMLIANESDQFFGQKITTCLDFLNQIEKDLKLKRTIAFECENYPDKYNPGGVYLLKASQRWMLSPPLISLYTTLVRCGFVHTIDNNYVHTLNGIANGTIKAYQSNDSEFVKSSFAGISAIIALGYRKIFYGDMTKNYPKHIQTSILHHDCGIRAYSWGYTKKNFPYWHRDNLLEILKERDIVIENLWTTKSEDEDCIDPPQVDDKALLKNKTIDIAACKSFESEKDYTIVF